MSNDENNFEPEHDDGSPISRSLVYLVSPRGGDNFYARVINGADKEYLPEPNVPDWIPRKNTGLFEPELNKRIGEAAAKGEISGKDLELLQGSGAVYLQPTGRATLVIWSRWMNVASAADRKLCLIHEAGHLALRHLERSMKVINNATEPEIRAAIAAVNNWAVDFAVNDSVVRLEKEFATVHRKRIQLPDGTSKLDENGEWHFLMPEEYGLPVGRSYEDYLAMMLDNLEDIAKKADQLLESMLKEMLSEEGDGEEQAGGQGGDADGEGKEGQSGSSGSSGKGSQPGKNRGGSGSGSSKEEEEKSENSMAAAANKVRELMKKNPEKYKALFEKLAKAHEKLTGQKHKQWSEMAQKMSPEEALSIAEKLKKQVKGMVSKAWDQSVRTRGLLPGVVQQSVAQLMAPAQVPWHLIFRDIVSASVSSRLIEEMACPSLMLINEDDIEPWPGFAIDQKFNVTFMIDTSGSVQDSEFARACNELNSIMSGNKNINLTVLQCDAINQSERTVSTGEPLSTEDRKALLARSGYGGTVYSPAFRRMRNEDTASDWVNGQRPEEPHPQPDLVIVFSDGGVVLQGEVFPQYRPPCGIVWLLAPNSHAPAGMSNTAPDRVIQMFEIKAEFSA